MTEEMRIFLDLNGSLTEVYPVNESVSHKNAKDDLSGYYKASIETTFKFMNTDLHSTFDELVKIENQTNACLIIDVHVRFPFFPGDGTQYILFEGELNLKKCEFNYDEFTVTGKFDNNTYSILEEKDKVNLYELIPDRHNPLFYVGELQRAREAAFGDFKAYKPNAGWTLYEEKHFVLTADPLNNQIHRFWVREFFPQDPQASPPTIGDGWLYQTVDKGWYRPVPTIFIGNNYDIELLPGENSSFLRQWTYCDSKNATNGMHLTDVLNTVFRAGTEFHHIESDFFNIDPQGTSPSNIAYDFASDFCHNIIMVGGSDIQQGLSDQNQFIYETTPFKIWKGLKTMFNLTAKLIDDVLSIEHVSNNEAGVLVDMVENGRLIFIPPIYKNNAHESTEEESFSMHSDTGSIDFDGIKIKYLCGEAQPDSIVLEDFITNVNSWSNSKTRSDKEESLVLLSKDNSFNYINRAVGALSGDIIINGCFSWANLIYGLHLWERPAFDGVITYTKSVRKVINTEFGEYTYDIDEVIEQELNIITSVNGKVQEFKIPMNTLDYKDLTIDSFIRTQFGYGKVIESGWSSDNIYFAKIIFQK